MFQSTPAARAELAEQLHAYADALAAGHEPVPALQIVEADGFRMKVVPVVIHNLLCAWWVATPQETDPVVLGCAGCGLAYPHEPAAGATAAGATAGQHLVKDAGQ